jgi:hypothetical protein
LTALSGPAEIVWESEPSLVQCFLCGCLLTYPAIHWSGAGGHIYLDRACFPELFAWMAVDLHVINRRMRGTL